ncbi:MAG: oligosaccharide flippase family protein [Candidatus Binataceae bacterium]|nr:oligosaccharide flippase family protein [Candidatus Binataceae bacterium]
MSISVRRNIAWSYATWATAAIAPLILVPLYVRFLGKDLYGQWLVISSSLAVIALAGLGIAQTVCNRVAEAVACKRTDELGQLVSTAFFAYVAIAAGLLTAAVIFSPRIAARLTIQRPSVVAAFLIFSGLSLVTMAPRIYEGVLDGYQRVDWRQRIATVSSLVRIAAIAIAVLCGFKLIAVALVSGAELLIRGAVAWFLTARLNRDLNPRLTQVSGRIFKELIKPSLGFFSLRLGGTLIVSVDNLVIGYALGGQYVTIYAVPYRLTSMVISLFHTALGAVTPTVTAHHALDRGDRIARGLVFATRSAVMYSTVAVITLWLLGPAFLRLWAGPGIFPGNLTYALELAMIPLSLLVSVPSTILVASTRHYTQASLTMAEGLLNLSLSIWWVRHWGLAGVIGGTIVASIVTTSWYVPIAAMKVVRLQKWDMARALAPGFALMAGALTLTGLLWHGGAPVSIARAIAGSATMAGGFTLLFMLFGFSEEDRRWMRSQVYRAVWRQAA